MKKHQLKVVYDGEHKPDLDRAIRQAVKPFGFKEWASGYDLVNEKRDLAFEINKG